MEQIVIIVFASWLAGIASFVGGFFAKYEGSAETEIKLEIIH